VMMQQDSGKQQLVPTSSLLNVARTNSHFFIVLVV
jgi:hypothetical protein